MEGLDSPQAADIRISPGNRIINFFFMRDPPALMIAPTLLWVYLPLMDATCPHFLRNNTQTPFNNKFGCLGFAVVVG
jgi:hypothetical protein